MKRVSSTPVVEDTCGQVEKVRAFRVKMRKEAKRNYSRQRTLLRNLKKRQKALKTLLAKINDHWEIEDIVYRLYHESHKVRFAMDVTRSVLKELESVYPNGWKNRCPKFIEIMEDGLNPEKDGRHWVEAMLHARYFLEMAVRYSREVDKPLRLLPSGYAALLYLYGLR